MSATLTYLAPQSFDRAAETLKDAQSRYTEAMKALAEAKCSLEFKRAELLEKGVEGKNIEAREAAIRLKFFDSYSELLGLEVSLNEAKRDLEQARVTWNCLRYKLRLLEVERVLEGMA